MTTLVLHPDDRSTDDLRPLYEGIPDRTVITGGRTKDEVRALVAAHDRVILCGHGYTTGLFSIDRFPTDNGLIIDASMVDVLSEKHDTIYLWCYAHEFVRQHGLRGFSSGMFISEVQEAQWMGLEGVTQAQVDESTQAFCRLMGQHVLGPQEQMFATVHREYGLLAQRNPVAAYNHARLHLGA